MAAEPPIEAVTRQRVRRAVLGALTAAAVTAVGVALGSVGVI